MVWQVSKFPEQHHTEVMLILLVPGEEGERVCQMVLRIKTIGLWSGKDTEEKVDNNMKKIFKVKMRLVKSSMKI